MINIAEDLDESRLKARARALGAALEGGDVLLLEGGMGAGKTTFTRALAEGLGVDRPDRVTSPTFALCLIHPGRLTLVHVDLYRLENTGDSGSEGGLSGDSAAAEALGLDSGELHGGDRVLIVEWPERWISPPQDHLEITILRPPGVLTRRHLSARAGGPRSSQLLSRWLAAGPRDVENSQ